MERPRLAITANDDAIGHALKALDRKLDAWLAALKTWSERHSIEVDESPSSPHNAHNRTNEPGNTSQAGTEIVAPAASHKESTSAPPRKGKPMSQRSAAEPTTAPAVVRMAEPRDAAKLESPDVEATANTGPSEADAAAPASHSATAPCEPAVDEDEALLATLDPETARAIRVMRRLSDNKRSVRDLLAEMEANKAKPKQTETRRKSWWR